MRVLVTGATGFVGSHAAVALREAGHDVRVLARRPERVAPALAVHGEGIEVDVAAGDMTDADAVAAAVENCDAVVHAAGEIGVADGTGPASNANVEGVRTVIGAALAAGCDPIVYTSTVTVHLPTGDDVITLDTSLAEPHSAYGASKLQAELLVREWQAEGAPVTSFTLGGVYGPRSPHLDGSFAAILGAMGAFMLVPPGGLGVVDVRDLAAMIVAAVEPGRGPRHYLAGGTYVAWADWVSALSEGAGVDVAGNPVTAEELLELGRQCDELRAQGQDSLPLSAEAAVIMSAGRPTDDTATLDDLGVRWRPLVDTFRDTVDWLRSIGELPPAP